MFILIKLLLFYLLQLTSDLVQNWIISNPEASICTPEGVHNFKEMSNFQDYHGLPEFRNVSNNIKINIINPQINKFLLILIRYK